MKTPTKIALTIVFVSISCKASNSLEQSKNGRCQNNQVASKTALALEEQTKSSEELKFGSKSPLGGILEYRFIAQCSIDPNITVPSDKGLFQGIATTKFYKSEDGKFTVQIFSDTLKVYEIFRFGENLNLRINMHGNVQTGLTDPISIQSKEAAAKKEFYARQAKVSAKDNFPLCSKMYFLNNVMTFRKLSNKGEQPAHLQKYCIDSKDDVTEPAPLPLPRSCSSHVLANAMTFDIPADQASVKSGLLDTLVAQTKNQEEILQKQSNSARLMSIKSKEYIDNLASFSLLNIRDNRLYAAQLIAQAKPCDPASPEDFCGETINKQYFTIVRDLFLEGNDKILATEVLDSNFSEAAIAKFVENNDAVYDSKLAAGKQVLAKIEEIREIYKADPSKLALLSAHVPNKPNFKSTDIVFAALPLTGDTSNPYVGMLKFVLQGGILQLLKENGPGRQNLNQPFQTTNIVTYAGSPIAAFMNETETSGGASVMELPKRVQRTEDSSSQKNKDTVDSSKDPKNNKTGTDECL